jgi:tetratricopeptide (TPR) repeat protein
VAEGVLEKAEHADLIPVIADTLVTKGSSLEQTGRSAEGIALLRAGREMAEAHGLADTQLRALGNLGSAESSRDPRRALEIGREGLAVMRRLGTHFGMSNVFYNAVYAAMRVGEWDWAIAELDTALAEELEPSDRAEIGEIALRFHAYRGDPVGEMLQEVERLLEGATDPYRVATLLLARADVALPAGRLSEARPSWKRAHELLRHDDALTWMARAAEWDGDADTAREDLRKLDEGGLHGPAIDANRTTIRGGLAALDGRPGEALALYREGLAAWRELGAAWDEALCTIDMATLLDPSEPDVQAAAEAGRAILTRLGAKPFLERLESAMARRPTSGAATLAQEDLASAPARA